MKKPIEVKEYQAIVCKSKEKLTPKYNIPNNVKPIEDAVFKQLQSFIEKFGKSKDISDVHEFISIEHNKDFAYTITLKNYVGLIQLKDGTQLNVLPKIDFVDDKNNFGDDENAGNEKTKRTFLYMLQSMKNFPGKSFNVGSLNVARMSLLDIFIRMYLQEVWKLVKQGIRSSYVSEEDNLRYFRGKLLFAQHLRYNLAHQERFYVIYEDFNINRPENKLIKAMLLKLQRLTSDTVNSQFIKQLLAVFDSVDASTNFVKDFQKVVNNRDTMVYTDLISWTKIFLFNQTFTPFAGSNSATSFLFPMEQVFEEYVAKMIKKIFTPNEGWDVSCQEKKLSLSTEPEMFWLKPDIVLKYHENSQDQTIIMDTKWKRLKADIEKNYGIEQDDIYQMYAYAKRYQSKHIWLLYPNTKEVCDKKEFEIFDGTEIRIFFVDVAKEKIMENLGQLKKEVYEALRLKC